MREEWTHSTGVFVGGHRKVEEACHMMDLGVEFSG